MQLHEGHCLVSISLTSSLKKLQTLTVKKFAESLNADMVVEALSVEISKNETNIAENTIRVAELEKELASLDTLTIAKETVRHQCNMVKEAWEIKDRKLLKRLITMLVDRVVIDGDNAFMILTPAFADISRDSPPTVVLDAPLQRVPLKKVKAAPV